MDITPDLIETLVRIVVVHRLDALELPGLVIRKSQHEPPAAPPLAKPRRPGKPSGQLPPEPEELLHLASTGGRRTSPAEQRALDGVAREIDEEAGRG